MPLHSKLKEKFIVKPHTQQGWQSAFCVGGGGVREANKPAPETLTCRGFWGNSLPEIFEILKLANVFLVFTADCLLKSVCLNALLILFCFSFC